MCIKMTIVLAKIDLNQYCELLRMGTASDVGNYRGENPRESYLCPHPEIWRFSGISPPKIPEIVIVPVQKVSPKLLESLAPSPSPNFGVFQGFSPENPRYADCPHPRPRNIGEIVKISGIPRKSPKLI